MSLRNRIFLLFSLSALAVFTACGGGGGTSVTQPTPPPSGGFGVNNLNGTYIFSVSGTDTNGSAYAAVGSFTANGSGAITGGTLDLNDAGFATSSPVISPVANVAISSASTYKIGADGRGQATLFSSTPFGSSILVDFVLQDSNHGLITEFDGSASGSGTLDLQSSGVTPSGSYAFLFSGAYGSSFLTTVGNFTLGNGDTMTGIEDLNSEGIPYVDETLSGSLVLGPSSTPATQISSVPTSGVPNFVITYDVYAIDATHLKFIEMDASGTLSGDAFAQSNPTLPTGTLAFTLLGSTASAVIGAGGFMVTDGNGNITNSSTEDINNTGSVSSSFINFSATYTAGGTGRYTLGSFSGFIGATELAAYPSSGGLLLLEIDTNGTLAGAAYQQTAGATLAASQGYAMNLSGVNLGAATGQSAEVDDIAEFATASSGGTLSGVTDENFAPGSMPNYGLALSGTYAAPDANGRGQLSANAGNSSNTTLNGGFGITYYAVDGTIFPFIESDSGQVAVGVFLKQNSSASSSAAAKIAHPFFVPSLMHAQTRMKRK
jgi:hypothetical protein